MSFHAMLKAGGTVQTLAGDVVKVGKLLGRGGQGQVWTAEYDGATHALKWYDATWVTADDELAGRLVRLVEKGPPNPSFVWPEAVVIGNGLPSFGYLMPLLDLATTPSLRVLDTRKVTPTFRELATIGYGIAEAFWSLHAKGLCYRDISKDNIHFDPSTGGVRIVDNDNVDVDGTAAAIDGTIEFMAPELVRRDPGARANRHTDYHSLAVLLFYVFHIHHPLEGGKKLKIRCWDEAAQLEMYGRRPLFIFDEKDRSNQAQRRDPKHDPAGEAGDNAILFWAVYPDFFKEIFHRAFTVGLRDPYARPPVTEWRRALVRLRDSVVHCPHCRSQNFGLETGGVVAGKCSNPACQKPVPTPFRLTVSQQTVMLNADTQLFPHHIDKKRLFDFSSPVARLKQHPAQPNVWGLNNVSLSSWTGQLPNGSMIEVPPGKSLPLSPGIRVNFGSAEGLVSL